MRGSFEKNFIRTNASKKTDKQIAEELSGLTGKTFTLSAVRKMRQRMNIKKKHGRGKCELDPG